MPVRRNSAKPGLVASSVYEPTGRAGKAYAPLSLLVAVRLCCVSPCVNVTSAPGTTAPELSVMTPEIEAVDTCPMSKGAPRTSETKMIGVMRFDTDLLLRRGETPLNNLGLILTQLPIS